MEAGSLYSPSTTASGAGFGEGEGEQANIGNSRPKRIMKSTLQKGFIRHILRQWSIIPRPVETLFLPPDMFLDSGQHAGIPDGGIEPVGELQTSYEFPVKRKN